MNYFTIGTTEYYLLGISNGEVSLGIDSILRNSISLVRDDSNVYFHANNGSLDIAVKDNDDNWNLADIYKAFKQLYKNRDLTNLIPTELDTSVAKAFKEKVSRVFTKNIVPATGMTIQQFSSMFEERVQYEMLNTDSGFYRLNKNILNAQSIVGRSNDEAKKIIADIIGTTAETYENVRVLSDDQEIFFYATDHSVMPSYDEVVDIEVGTLDEYNMKNIVPRFHQYIGPFMNYTKGTVGSVGSYVNGEYIKDATVAELMNDVMYRQTLATNRQMYINKTVGMRKINITPSVIEGEQDYDADGIQSGEQRYFEALCKFVDECFDRDILEAPVSDWISLGLEVRKYLPELKYTSVPFGKIDAETLELVPKGSESRGFNIQSLERVGLTRDVFHGLGAGSPTSIKWFEYAINVALLTTRYYSGGVRLPFGYDEWDFNKNYPVDVSFDSKYSMYMSGKVKIGNRILTADEIDLMRSSESDDPVTFEDYGDIDTERGAAYWLGYAMESAKGGNGGESDSSSSDSKNDSVVGMARDVLMDSVCDYCRSSGIFYAFPEALIKCLRFGKNKPKSLQLDSLSSRVNLTTGELVTDIDRSTPVEFDDGKQYIISSLVTSNALADNVKELLKDSTGYSKFNNMLVGVGLTSRFKQPDGSVVNIVEYYDIQTLVNDTDLCSKIANFSDGKIIESSPKAETLTNMLSAVSRSVTTKSIQMNDVIMMNIINKNLSKLSTDKPAYKIVTNLNRKGFNMFTFISSLANIRELTVNVKFVNAGKVTNKLESLKSADDVSMLLYAETLVKFGKVIAESMQVDTSGNKLFEVSFRIWKECADYSISTSNVGSAPNSINPVDEYVKLVSDKLPAGSKWAIVQVVNDNGGKKEIVCYLLGNKEIRKEYVVLSSIIPIEVLNKYNKDASGIKGMPLQRLLQSILQQSNKCKDLSINDIVKLMFNFIDDKTRDRITNIIVNKLKA